MASQSLTRLLSKQKTVTSLLSRRFSVAAATATSTTVDGSRRFLLGYLRPLSSAVPSELRRLSLRGFSTDAEPAPAPAPAPESDGKTDKKKKEKGEDIMLDGCDFKHWMALMEKPKGDPTREEIIEGYIKTLASIIGSEEEAKKTIYSVSTKCYYAFSYIGEKDISEKLNELDHVLFVVPDSYLDPRNKDYGGEPFINGKAVPYDPKYHKDWLRNNQAKNQNENSAQNNQRGGPPRYNNQQNGLRGGYNNQQNGPRGGYNNQQNGPRGGYNNQQNGPRGGYNNQQNSPREDGAGSGQGL